MLKTVLVIGDSGAGKSETLEALRGIIGDQVEELMIVADDMGSIDQLPDGRIVGYGTEIGAFVRLDDLQKGYALRTNRPDNYDESGSGKCQGGYPCNEI